MHRTSQCRNENYRASNCRQTGLSVQECELSKGSPSTVLEHLHLGFFSLLNEDIGVASVQNVVEVAILALHNEDTGERINEAPRGKETWHVHTLQAGQSHITKMWVGSHEITYETMMLSCTFH